MGDSDHLWTPDKRERQKHQVRDQMNVCSSNAAMRMTGLVFLALRAVFNTWVLLCGSLCILELEDCQG